MRKQIVRGAIALATLVVAAATTAWAEEPDGLRLQPGFKASVVTAGIEGGARHLAVNAKGDIYASTRGGPGGIVAIRLGPNGEAAETVRFGKITDGGTGIRFYRGDLYTTTRTAIYRFKFKGNSLTPIGEPDLIVDGMPANGQSNRPIAFDAQGRLLVAVGGPGNLCAGTTAQGATPVGLSPCPDLETRAGIWRFDRNKLNQAFLKDGEKIATGVRDAAALDLRKGDDMFVILQGRNDSNRFWPNVVSDENAVSEEMHRVVKGADYGWPYTYFDGAKKLRLKAPEYGGDATTAADGYATPVASFIGHSSPMDLLFYEGRQFPKAYRGGAFIAFHGAIGAPVEGGRNGYNVAFVPFDKDGNPGAPVTFIDGFAGPSPNDRSVTGSAHRPIGLATAPNGALYVADSKTGKIWRITYAP